MRGLLRRYRHLAMAALGSALVLSAGGVRVHAAATAADLFDPNTLQELRLRINSRDWAELTANFRLTDGKHYPAMLQWRDVRVWNVSVRMRGAGTRNPYKPPLQLDFARYATRQRFLGLSALSLDNHWQDPSQFRERTAMAFFNRMGQRAPRESSARVYINDVYYGVYTLIENIDPIFLARNFGDVIGRANLGGFLYEYHNLGPYYLADLGDSLDAYKALFEARTRTTEAGTTLYSPIREWVKEVNAPYDAAWRSRVEQYFDLPQLMTYVAIENFLTEWDGFTGQWGMNNFYLYRNENSTKLRIIPWDSDITFTYYDAGILERADQNVLFSRAIQFGDLRTLYLDVMEQCARSATQDHWLENQILGISALLKDSIHSDPVKQWSNDFGDQDTAGILQWVRVRPDLVLSLVAQARLSPAPQ